MGLLLSMCCSKETRFTEVRDLPKVILLIKKNKKQRWEMNSLSQIAVVLTMLSDIFLVRGRNSQR